MAKVTKSMTPTYHVELSRAERQAVIYALKDRINELYKGHAPDTNSASGAVLLALEECE